MITFPNGKINLGLHILQKRSDGYHDIETVFCPVALQDGLEVLAAPAGSPPFSLSLSGSAIDTDTEKNSCYKAWSLIKADHPELPAIHAHLHKTIPSGGGLGGGSADGSFMLKLLNDTFRLGITGDRLAAYALQLGSDCPFFLHNQPCLATGRGEVLEPMVLDLSAYRIVLVNPGVHVNTGWAFSQVTPRRDGPSLKTIAEMPVSTWKEEMVNDFEAPVGAAFPAITTTKEALYAAGAVYAAMSGSGATVFGLFRQEAAPALSFPEAYFVRHLQPFFTFAG